MVLKRTLKKVITGVVALAYLQQAIAVVDRDIIRIKCYWQNRMVSMKKETQTRADFLNRAKAFECREIPSEKLDGYLKEGESSLLSIQTQLAAFKESTISMIEKTEELHLLNIRSDFNLEISDLYDSIKELLPSALEKDALLKDGLKRFDSCMLRMIREYSENKHAVAKIHEMRLFRLAQRNKSLALHILYSFFRVQPCISNSEVDDAVKYMTTGLDSNIFRQNYIDYILAITKCPTACKKNILLLGETHLEILFRGCGITPETLDMYIGLSKKDFSEADLKHCMHITPGEVIQTIMLEYMLNKDLLDYQRNNLFSNLGKIIARIGKPANGSTDIQKDLKIAREKQDKILDALHLLWNDATTAYIIAVWIDPDTTKITARIKNIEFFCSKYGISYKRFKDMQEQFTFASWMYKSGVQKPNKHVKQYTLLKGMHLDMSYIHPMLYIYQRCEDMSHPANTEIKHNEEFFLSRYTKDISALNIYKISRTKDDSEKIENIKDCIRAWFLQRNSIIIVGEDSEESRSMAKEFKIHLSKSLFIEKVLIDSKAEGRNETRACASNPLQDNQMEVE
ncbi:hypothetical protein NEMIN01_0361 [Nematocida minor]|uniref:uncharacterized protein n=1 Tax=Nematocida minor TaxID=1912983 RepID=UPI00221E720D|nr:uncharacterized protein NEMIN01_0361 [Nematocida minor]KAI5189195.1 hypothetical protein NEMIN01_0361 [Nematocida minor]